MTRPDATKQATAPPAGLADPTATLWNARFLPQASGTDKATGTSLRARTEQGRPLRQGGWRIAERIVSTALGHISPSMLAIGRSGCDHMISFAWNKMLRRAGPYLALASGLSVFGIILRAWALPGLYYLCDDSSIIVGARNAVERSGVMGLMRLFVADWGPNMIRPFEWIGLEIEQNILHLPYGASVSIGVALMAMANCNDTSAGLG